LPHAATTSDDWRSAEAIVAWLRGPTGSSTRRRASGRVERHAKRLTTSTPPKPQALAKPTQRRMVGSSTRASAVLGLSMMKVTRRGDGCHSRRRW